MPFSTVQNTFKSQKGLNSGRFEDRLTYVWHEIRIKHAMVVDSDVLAFTGKILETGRLRVAIRSWNSLCSFI